MVRIASRGSTLALWQAEHVRSRLRELHRDVSVDIEVVHTTGDLITDVPLAKIGDRGLFTKEVDSAILDGRCDIAVHSLKDVPTAVPDGLTIAAVLKREDARDAFLPCPGAGRRIADLRTGARVGTSSLRRRALLLAARDDLAVDDLRGNLDTRLEKLSAGAYDGIILALAGLRRFGRADAAGEILGPPHWLPAVGQGALAIVTRADDAAALAAVRPLDHAETRSAADAERAFLAALEGGCQIPIGALATIADARLTLRGLVASLDGRTVVRGEVDGPVGTARAIGETLAHRLEQQGAGDILRMIRSSGMTAAPPAP
ncbi:MAG TPA: hydroxymethylbilane synthase [Longimicrobiales bacterium]